MRLFRFYIFLLLSVSFLYSCAPSATSNLISGEDLSQYQYVVWPSDITGDRELDYVMFEAYNALKNTRLEVISERQLTYSPLSETLIAHCHVSQNTSKSVVTIDFKNALTNLPVLYVKGSFGMGWGMTDDMKGAINSLKKRLLKLFPKE